MSCSGSQSIVPRTCPNSPLNLPLDGSATKVSVHLRTVSSQILYENDTTVYK